MSSNCWSMALRRGHLAGPLVERLVRQQNPRPGSHRLLTMVFIATWMSHGAGRLTEFATERCVSRETVR